MKITFNNPIIQNSGQNKNTNKLTNNVSSPNDIKNLGVSHSSIYTPNFTGFFGLFSRKTTDSTILSPKQIEKQTKAVTAELCHLLDQEDSPTALKRLNTLLNSDFLKYNKEITTDSLGGTTSLKNEVLYRRELKNNKVYNNFLLRSLGELMPFEDSYSKDLKRIYTRNHGIVNLFKNYKNIDENSEEAKLYQKMLTRLKGQDFNCPDLPEFFADCMINNKPKMCRFLQETFDINPATKIQIIEADPEILKGGMSKNLGYSTTFNIPTYETEQPLANGIFYPIKQKMDEPNNENFAGDFIFNTENISLYDLYKITPNANPECFDIPKFLYNQGKYIDNRVSATETFFENNHSARKPNSIFQRFSVLEKLANMLKADGKDYIRSLRTNYGEILEGEGKVEAALDRLSELAYLKTPEYEVVRNLCTELGRVNQYDEKALQAKLTEIDKIAWAPKDHK